MGAPSEFSKDFYEGLKMEAKQAPFTVASVVFLWVAAWAVYFFVYPDLARSAEVKPIQQEVRSQTIQNLDREILAVLTQRCTASTKSFLTSRLQVLLVEYDNKAEKPYPRPLPSCAELN